jgi:hypothetical protein
MRSEIKYYRDELVFTWSGGAYIEISHEDSEIPFDVYNVWNYETDEPKIERSMRGLVDFIDTEMLEES